jgi:hypothetical protein
MNAALGYRKSVLLLSIALRRSRLETRPTASLTFHLLAAQLEKAFAFAIFAFGFLFSSALLHVFLDRKAQ